MFEIKCYHIHPRNNFIAFSSDQTSLEVYRYQGPAAAADLLKDVQGEHLDNQQTPTNNRLVQGGIDNQ